MVTRSRAGPFNACDGGASTSNVRYGLASLLGDAAERRQIVLPLDGQERLLAVVAVLAGGHDVAAHAATAASERHDVIHGECSRADPPSAVVADAGRELALPPAGVAKLPGARPLTAQDVGIDGRVELIHGWRARWRAPPTPASATQPALRPPGARGRRRERARHPRTAQGLPAPGRGRSGALPARGSDARRRRGADGGRAPHDSREASGASEARASRPTPRCGARASRRWRP